MPTRVFSDAERGNVLFTDFDVDSYSRNARGRIGVDGDAVAAAAPDDITAADLAFLWRLDTAGLSETRAMLAAWTGNEARITAFIATWAYERMWLAQAVKDVLDSAGVPTEPRDHDHLAARLRGVWVERLMPLTVPPVATTIGEAFTAGHMIRMALQEASLQAAYAELAPRLEGEARRVVELIVERRQTFVDFYHREASARIARSPRERTMARLALVGWQPLRIVGVPDPDEPRALANILLTDAARQRLDDAQRPTLDLLRGIGLVPGTDRDGGPAPAPTRGLRLWRKHNGL
ncbi:hypothetical protein ACQCX5_08155 [Propionibacteriaceae bacterium G57]|uniref:hypothetical protein n=1 Tax=Aestuariimicrobium sp. G57 TaxID=3418485 RepID=UPI003DA6D3D9